MTGQDENLVNAGPTPTSNCNPLQGGDQRSCDLPVSSVLHQIESTYGFTPLTITVGTAYFRRLAASNQAMLQVSASHPSFIGLVRGLTFEEPGKPLVGAIHAPYLSNEVWLTLIHLTCTYIAAKNLAHAPLRCSLQAIISHIYGVQPSAIDLELSSDLEIQCLEALDWRLGPPVVQQEDVSYAANRRLPVSPLTRNQESGNNETRDPALSWVAGTELSTVSVERVEPVLPELSHALSRTQGTSAQSKSAISQLERGIHAWHQHRAVQWSWNLTSIFLMFLLIATRFNTYFMAAAFVPSFLGQQIASWGLALAGWGLDTQKNMAKWFLKALRAGAIITALCSAAVAAAISYDVFDSAVACELLHVSGAVSNGPVSSGVSTCSMSSMEGFIGVCYALHAMVSIMAAKSAHQVQSILDQNDDAMMV